MPPPRLHVLYNVYGLGTNYCFHAPMPLRALREPLEPLEPVSLRALRTFEGGFNALADLISYVLCQVAANMLIQIRVSFILDQICGYHADSNGLWWARLR